MTINSLNTWKAWAQSFPQKAGEDAPAYKSPFTVVNKTDKSAEILIYDQIGRDFWSGEGMAANDFAELLKGIDSKAELTIGINSPGGNCSDGMAIANMIDRWPGNTITRNDGMAASIASHILQAGKVRQTSASAMVMIHKAWGMMVGNEEDAGKFQSDLRKYDQVIAERISARSGKTVADVMAAMSAETFYTGSEAKTFGLVDSVIDSTAKKTDLQNFIPPVAAVQNLTAQAVKPDVQTDAAGKQTTKGNTMTTDTTAPAAQTQPALDTDKIVNAITALGDKLPKPTVMLGAEPTAVIHAQNLGSPAVEKFRNNEKNAAHKRFIVANYETLRKELVGAGVFNANTVDSGLANSLLVSDAVDVMRTKFAAFGNFSRRINLSPVSKRQVLNVPKISSAGSMQTNATNYETGDTTAADIAVTVNEYSKSFTVSRGEQNLGLALAQYANTNALVLAEGVAGLVTALMTNANYGADNVIGAAANFDSADLPAVLALGKNFPRTNLLLDGGHLAYLLPVNNQAFKLGEDGAFGFDSIQKNNLWTGGASDICGFICSPDAIAIATGPAAMLPSGEAMTQETVDVGGITLTSATWFSRASHSFWGAYYIMFGCAVGDATQGKVLTTQ